MRPIAISVIKTDEMSEYVIHPCDKSMYVCLQIITKAYNTYQLQRVQVYNLGKHTFVDSSDNKQDIMFEVSESSRK